MTLCHILPERRGWVNINMDSSAFHIVDVLSTTVCASDILVSELDPQSSYCVHFLTNTLGEGISPLIPLAMCKISLLFFGKDFFSIKLPMKVYMPLNKEIKPVDKIFPPNYMNFKSLSFNEEMGLSWWTWHYPKSRRDQCLLLPAQGYTAGIRLEQVSERPMPLAACSRLYSRNSAWACAREINASCCLLKAIQQEFGLSRCPCKKC